jgi:cadherin 5 type 2 (VE-cadherin)
MISSKEKCPVCKVIFFCDLQVQYLNTEDVLIQNLTLRNSITLTDLKPHRNYTFTVVVRSGTESQVLRRSLPVSAIFTTMESVPGKVRSGWN